MKTIKLSIVIVSWNVQALLEKCLRSIQEKLSPSLPYEIIVIDNASYDGTPDMVMSSFRDVKVKLIENSTNRGFSTACNQGSHAAQGEYIAFLNPDTEIKEQTFETLISFLDSHPDTAIVGPRIIYEDGALQSSARGFPTPFVCILIFLKLDRVLKFLPAVRSYFAYGFDYAKTQEAEQLMGACLLMRRFFFEHLGRFDERFFLWFEEVDLCKRARDAGFKIYYIAESVITHKKAKSFSQQSIITRQKNFYESCAKYLCKHFSGSFLQSIVSGIFSSYTRFLGIAIYIERIASQRSHKRLFRPDIFAYSFILIGAMQFLSLLVYSDILPAQFVFFFLLACTFIISLWRLPLGIAIVFSELFIGSKGYLFSLDSWDSRISIRIGIFAAVFIAWVLLAVRAKLRQSRTRTREPFFTIFGSRFLWWYVSLALTAGYGVIHALIRGTPLALVIQDANAWLFFFIAPAVYDAIRSRENVSQLVSCLAAALVLQTMSVLLTFYIMGHQGFGEIILGGWYYWIRHSGVGEITALTGSATRIFFQSQIFSLAGILILFGLILSYVSAKLDFEKQEMSSLIHSALRAHRYFFLFLAGLFASVFISFSRSLWIGGIVAGILFLVLARSYYRISMRAIFLSVVSLAVSAGLALGILVGISGIPFPPTTGVFNLQSLEERVKDLADEQAAKSRWKLLPVLFDSIKESPLAGYGFGKTVSYESSDPRNVARQTGELYTTYAFEWGFLDIWIKLGLAGLLVYIGFCFALMRQGVRLALSYLKKGAFIYAGFISGAGIALVALFFTNIFTPYLNHPLGIGIIILSGMLFDRFSKS